MIDEMVNVILDYYCCDNTKYQVYIYENVLLFRRFSRNHLIVLV